jgi:hypothetical protein
MKVVVCHRSNNFGSDFDFIDITKGFFDKENPLSIVRKIPSLAEMRETSYVRRQLVHRISPFILGQSGGDACRKDQYKENRNYSHVQGSPYLINKYI